MANAKDGNGRAADIIKNWIRTRTTLEFLGTWEQLYNPEFKVVEFDHFKMEAGLPSFVLSPSKWLETTNAKGIYTKKGKYGGTYAHKDIAFEFGPFFYFGAETDTDFEGKGYLSTEYSDNYNSDCYVGIRIGKAENGEVLVKLKKNCNNKIQDITLDNFPNLRLKKTNN